MKNDRFIFCPFCGSKLSVDNTLLSSEKLFCPICGGKMKNIYYKNVKSHLPQNRKNDTTTDMAKKEIIIIFSVVAFFVCVICFCFCGGCDDDKEYVPENSEEWKVAAVNSEWDWGRDEGYSDEIMFDYEKKYGRTIQSVLSKYVNREIVGDQVILTEEPLRSLIVYCVGDDGLNFMKTCKRSNDGVIKFVSMGLLNYQYDCFKETPNGDYFAIALLIDENGKEDSFYLEIKINNIMNKFSFSPMYRE